MLGRVQWRVLDNSRGSKLTKVSNFCLQKIRGTILVWIVREHRETPCQHNATNSNSCPTKTYCKILVVSFRNYEKCKIQDFSWKISPVNFTLAKLLPHTIFYCKNIAKKMYWHQEPCKINKYFGKILQDISKKNALPFKILKESWKNLTRCVICVI